MFMMKNSYNFSIILILFIVAYLFTSAESKGGSSSGGGGSGGGGGRGFGGGAGRGGRFGGRRGAAAAVAIPAAGVVGYAAYQTHKGQGSRFHSNPGENPAIGTAENHLYDSIEDYKTQESTYYNRGEGFGMSAFGLLALILGIIGGGTLAYYCCIVGVPLWKDRQRGRRQSHDGHPLQETPSTATPSP